MSNGDLQIPQPIRLAEFSLLMAVLGIDPDDYYYVSREAQRSSRTDVEAIRTERSLAGPREESVVTVFLPSFKNYFPEAFAIELREESDFHAGEYDDRVLRFWSAFDTLTYRFWISFHILKLRMLLYSAHVDTELLYWARFGGEAPSLGREERKYLLLLRLFAPFFRGRRLLYERVLPAFLKKRVTVIENVPHRIEVPEEYRSSMGKRNSRLGRDFFPGNSFVENQSCFRVQVEDLDEEDVALFRPGGSARNLLDNTLSLFTPAHLSGITSFSFRSGLRMFVPGREAGICYLGFSTFLRESA